MQVFFSSLFILLFFAQSLVSGQSVHQSTFLKKRPVVSGAAENISHAQFRSGISPLKFWAVSGAAALILNRMDGEIDDDYSLNRNEAGYQALKPYGELGRLYDHQTTFLVLAGLMAANAAYGWRRHDTYRVSTTTLMIKSLAISSVATWLIKTTVGRHRPYTNDGPEKFDLFRFRTGAGQTSFPSGHTSSIFALMTVLSRRSHLLWISALAYGFAGSVAFQRMLDRKHWASDVFFGAALGYYVGRSVTGNVKSRKGDGGHGVQLKVSPLSLYIRF